MKLIVGLGNPGKQYERTRHNIGFMFIDALREFYEFPEFVIKEKFFAEISEKFFLNDHKTLLLKPQTFMNNSGRAVGAVMQYYDISPDDLIVAHDDLDIEIGHYKITRDVRAAGHNGAQDIMDYIGTQDFTRIRIGVEATGGRHQRGEITGKDFVLQNFREEEEKIAAETIETIIRALEWS